MLPHHCFARDVSIQHKEQFNRDFNFPANEILTFKYHNKTLPFLSFQIDKGSNRISNAFIHGYLSSDTDLIDIKKKNTNNNQDWAGLIEDTAYFMFYQVVAISFLYQMPESISGWSEETKKNMGFSQYLHNISRLSWDSDPWTINYILHPYWGATYYVRAHERGFGPWGGFWYSCFISTLYEYGFEALYEIPSIQDLIFTPVGGTLLGMGFVKIRNWAKGRSSGLYKDHWSTKLIFGLTDPFGVLNNGINRLIGRSNPSTIQPFAYIAQYSTATQGMTTRDELHSDCQKLTIGIRYRVQW